MNFYQLVQEAMKVEKYEMSNRERNQKRKFARGRSSLGKRIRESQAESVYACFNRPWFYSSYVCTKHLFDKMPSVEQLEYDMHVTNPLGHSVNVNQVYKNCLIMIHDRKFFTDLIALPFHEFDLILGMDWLSKHRAIVDCDKKTVVLKCSDLSDVTIHCMLSESVSNVISAMQARSESVDCEAFLALVLNSKRGQVNL